MDIERARIAESVHETVLDFFETAHALGRSSAGSYNFDPVVIQLRAYLDDPHPCIEQLKRLPELLHEAAVELLGPGGFSASVVAELAAEGEDFRLALHKLLGRLHDLASGRERYLAPIEAMDKLAGMTLEKAAAQVAESGGALAAA